MADESIIKLFEDKKIRIVWNEKEEKYYFSVVDIVEVLTDSADAKQYIKKMRARDTELDSSRGTNCTPTEMRAADGKKYKTQAADLEGILRIIQSIPSKKVEPVKTWNASWDAASSPRIVHPTISAPSKTRKPKNCQNIQNQKMNNNHKTNSI